jgi:hypothetical protein
MLFEAEPTSVAEVSVGQVLPLDRWPKGEIQIASVVAGRRAEVRLNPSHHLVTVNVYGPDLIASVAVANVESVTADVRSRDVRAMTVTIGNDGSRAHLVLRLRPDIELHFDGTA